MEHLQQEAETDLTFSLTRLTDFTMSLPSKRIKWSRHLMNAIKIKDECDENLKAETAELTVYYMDDYVKTIDRRDVEFYVNSDKKYKAKLTKLNDAKRDVMFCEKVLSSLEKASFDVGNVVKYEIFKAGG